ncbi:hypothetical protein ACRRTK_009556 [Alexandromys fortis]
MGLAVPVSGFVIEVGAFEEVELILHKIENYLLNTEDSILYSYCHGVTAVHCPAQNWRSPKLFHTRSQWEDKRKKEDEEEQDQKKRRRKEKKITPQAGMNLEFVHLVANCKAGSHGTSGSQNSSESQPTRIGEEGEYKVSFNHMGMVFYSDLGARGIAFVPVLCKDLAILSSDHLNFVSSLLFTLVGSVLEEPEKGNSNLFLDSFSNQVL